jgi:hypothetical protein
MPDTHTEDGMVAADISRGGVALLAVGQCFSYSLVKPVVGWAARHGV